MNKFINLVMLVGSLFMAQSMMGMEKLRPIEKPAVIPSDSDSISGNHLLKGVTVIGNKGKHFQMQSSQGLVSLDRHYLESHFSGSLMQSLNHLPGVRAMNIGSGQSKPMIRGLGFNRMVVAQDGIKHESQQWGEEHGLEIDQFDIDRIEIIKGPSALLYGSDAIGGVISLYSNFIPVDPFSATINLYGRSNNESIGLSTKVEGRKNHFYYKGNMTLINYADSKVPTDSIEYFSYWVKLKNQRLRNTAGNERDGSILLGYINDGFIANLRVADSYARSGFFANAHGLEVRLSSIDYDRSFRDIDLPCQSVNHLMIVNHTQYNKGDWSFEANLAYQNNLRKELAEPVSHGYMPKPEGTLERRFNKSTYTFDLGLHWHIGESNVLNAGVNNEWQHNRRGGWGFVIPDFHTFSTGFYAFDKYTASNNLILNAGLRYDFNRTRVKSYRDWYKTPVNEGMDSIFMERSGETLRRFNSLTWSAGVNYSLGEWVFKANVGKGFRIPIPMELGADGINYQVFRYEKGNNNLSPEESYQFDFGINRDNGIWKIQIDPYINYFPNYIYLNPTPDYAEGLQLYNYTQCRVFRWGLEAQIGWQITDNLSAALQGEYLYANQLSGDKKGFTLPFSVPWSADGEVKYEFSPQNHRENGYVSMNVHVAGDQNRIVPPEKITKGYYTVNFSAGKNFVISNCRLEASLNIDNILDRKYYDHTSYYRLMNIPEPGRMISLILSFKI